MGVGGGGTKAVCTLLQPMHCCLRALQPTLPAWLLLYNQALLSQAPCHYHPLHPPPPPCFTAGTPWLAALLRPQSAAVKLLGLTHCSPHQGHRRSAVFQLLQHGLDPLSTSLAQRSGLDARVLPLDALAREPGVPRDTGLYLLGDEKTWWNRLPTGQWLAPEAEWLGSNRCVAGWGLRPAERQRGSAFPARVPRTALPRRCQAAWLAYGTQPGQDTDSERVAWQIMSPGPGPRWRHRWAHRLPAVQPRPGGLALPACRAAGGPGSSGGAGAPRSMCTSPTARPRRAAGWSSWAQPTRWAAWSPSCHPWTRWAPCRRGAHLHAGRRGCQSAPAEGEKGRGLRGAVALASLDSLVQPGQPAPRVSSIGGRRVQVRMEEQPLELTIGRPPLCAPPAAGPAQCGAGRGWPSPLLERWPRRCAHRRARPAAPRRPPSRASPGRSGGCWRTTRCTGSHCGSGWSTHRACCLRSVWHDCAGSSNCATVGVGAAWTGVAACQCCRVVKGMRVRTSRTSPLDVWEAVQHDRRAASLPSMPRNVRCVSCIVEAGSTLPLHPALPAAHTSAQPRHACHACVPPSGTPPADEQLKAASRGGQERVEPGRVSAEERIKQKAALRLQRKAQEAEAARVEHALARARVVGCCRACGAARGSLVV